jgi:polyisoprenoid-binding protein YceI
MKKNSILLFAAAALFTVSCGESTTEETIEEVSYSADVKSSTISWRGAENDEHFHTGTISLKEGSLTMKGDEVVSGTFTVDMKTINAKTEGYPAEKMAYLNSHLADTAFFFVSDFPEVSVDILSYSKGKMKARFSILGSELEQDIAVTLKQDDKGASIVGKFKLNIETLNMPYLNEKNEETAKPALMPELEFDINLVLKK